MALLHLPRLVSSLVHCLSLGIPAFPFDAGWSAVQSGGQGLHLGPIFGGCLARGDEVIWGLFWSYS